MTPGRPSPPPHGQRITPVNNHSVADSAMVKGEYVSTLFTKILNGEIPGRFVWREADIAAFLTTGPLADGHTLVVPTEEVDKWTDASPETLARLISVAQRIGQAQVDVFAASRAGLIIAGYEINHLHVHVWPSMSMADFDFAAADQNPDSAVLDANAQRLRAGLRRAGHGEFVPAG